MTFEQIYEKYKARMLQFLKNIRAELNDNSAGDFGTCSEPFEMDPGELCMVIEKSRQNEDDERSVVMDIKFEVLDSLEYDGDEEEPGVNFNIEAVSYEGQEIARLCPYNYTNKVWVNCNDKDGIEERFKIIENSDISELIYYIEEYYNERKIN